MKEEKWLFELLREGVSPVQTVSACEKRLKEAGFEELCLQRPLALHGDGRYYAKHHDTTLFAFTVGPDWEETEAPGIRIAAAHTDFPCLRIKPSADLAANGYAQLNVEVYGGAILNTVRSVWRGALRCGERSPLRRRSARLSPDGAL